MAAEQALSSEFPTPPRWAAWAQRGAGSLLAVTSFTAAVMSPAVLAEHFPALQGWPATGAGVLLGAAVIAVVALCLRARPAGSAAARVQQGWLRVSLALYLAFALIGAGALVQAWQAERHESARAADAEIAEAAGRQSQMTQRVGRLAALMAMRPDALTEHAALLAAELGQSHTDGLRFETLLQPLARRYAGAQRAVEAWQEARERLWYRAGSLLAHVDGGRIEQVRDAAELVQRESDLAARAAQVLVVEFGRLGLEQQHHGLLTSRVGALLTLLLLGLLALAVVAPALRSARQQSLRLAEKSLENERLALVAEHTGNLVFITDRERRVVWVNEAFTRASGYELHEVAGRAPGEILHAERSDAAAVRRVSEALEAGRAVRAELLARSKDGRDFWIDTDIQPLHDAAGEVTGFLAVATDITEQVTQRLRTAALLAALPTGVVVHGRDGQVLDANPAARAMLGARPGDDALHLARLQPVQEDLAPWPDDQLPVPRTLHDGTGLRGQVLGVTAADGQRRWLHVNTQPLRDAVGERGGLVACYVDMSERRRLLEQLRDSARSDALTRLPNRTVVVERVQRAIEHRHRHPGYGFAVLFMDIDRFKQINDTLGHTSGDELLRQVAERLQETLRPGDAVARLGSELHTAARIGGDEFVIVLEGLRHTEDACTVAERLLQALAEPYTVHNHPVHASVSIGIVGADEAGDSADAVLRDCDTAMYEAKRAGRGRYMVFDASMRDRVVSALETERDLRRALERDELFVAYQPVLQLGSGTLAGVEALVRWQHPERGVVGPAQFIAVAEECGLIDAVGRTVLHAACRQFGHWQQQLGTLAPPQVSVNLSRAQLRPVKLAAEVAAALQEAGMQPGQLQLEVTESLAAQDEEVQATLRELKALGVRLALDDFGTGYSSLACLHQLPVDTVKIDRSFVAHAREVEYHRVLIEATIRVAKTLGMTTVAEGIEEADQAELMESMRCDRGQGYLFGRPMTAEAFERWVETAGHDTVA